MAPRKKRVLLPSAALAVLLLVDAAGASVLPSSVEQRCLKKIGTVSTRLARTAAKETAGCRDADINGSVPGACPNAGNLTKIAKTANKLIATANANCESVCSVSANIECVADALCPPRAGGGVERCSASLNTLPFDIGRIGFPGPYCQAVLGRPIRSAADIGECSRGVAERVATSLIEGIYGGLTDASGVSPEAAGCLAAVSKAVQKLVTATARSVGKCRASINEGALTADPGNCAMIDAKTVAKISAAEQAVRDTVASKCTVATLGELDICGVGLGAVSSIAIAQECLIALGREVADNHEIPVHRLFSPVSLIEAAYPPKPVCGDNLVNQLPNPFLLVGEECDGTDDSACPGECLPPGDIFECTCGDRPRMHSFSTASLTESDAGWTGAAHDQLTADQAGFIVDLTHCDCDGFTGADCTGASADAVCDVTGIQTPFCSWDATHSIPCDSVGNLDGKATDDDCKICDAFSINAGASCVNGSDCQAQCYNDFGFVTGACIDQRDCSLGEICRGRCDDSQTCVITTNGGPLPVAAAGAAVCNVQKFRSGITGTTNIVTGESELFFEVDSVTHIGERTSRPCPVCGGFCVGGRNSLEVCKGRCESSNVPCRFDDDCPGASGKCSAQTPDCPNGFCQLQLVCGTEPGSNDTVDGVPCRIEYESAYFGTPSSDCQPAIARNIGGQGFLVKHQPTGSEPKTLPFTIPCTATGFELFDCPCPDDGGEPTKPNACAPACNAAGPGFGKGCANGNSSGQGTKCSGGVNSGRLCDEDGDCPGSACSDNPTHCSGDPAFERFECTTNADCGAGTCGDACPGGRCIPLCVPEIADPEDGICAAGPPLYSCQNPAFGFVTCTQSAAEGNCAATCSVSATPCDSIDDCPAGEACQGNCESARDCEAGTDGTLGTVDDFVGAGPCVGKTRSCNFDPISVEGGDSLNGRGDHTNYLRTSIWCFSRTRNSGVNTASGFGGPGVTRERGVNVLNVDSIP